MSDDLRITVSLPSDLAARIDAYWHDNRIISRSEAVRLLLEQALAKTKARK